MGFMHVEKWGYQNEVEDVREFALCGIYCNTYTSTE
jgi:hypothetical protein